MEVGVNCHFVVRRPEPLRIWVFAGGSWSIPPPPKSQQQETVGESPTGVLPHLECSERCAPKLPHLWQTWLN